MVRVVAAIAIAIAVLALAPAALAASRGDADIAALQVGLRARGLYVGPTDGLRGPMTDQALRSLATFTPQNPVQEMRALLGDYGRYRLGGRTLRPGLNGWDVAAFQFLLAWQGFPSGPINGKYTERTANAVRRLQTSLAVTADGIAGPATITAVCRQPSIPPRPLLAPVGVAPSGVFGPRDDRFHTGIDYPAARGTPVRSAAAGTVVFAGWDLTGYGRLVTIDHGDGLQTMYAHLSRIRVRIGQWVPAGGLVAATGASGRSNGPHLHFEVRLRDAALDPLPALVLPASGNSAAVVVRP